MRRTSARRELAIVFAVAGFGLALVLVVAFTPWYSPDLLPSAEIPRLLRDAAGSAALTP